MIGIPPENTPEFISFSVSFWAALYSGLIYSLFTGIIVGLVIWAMQTRAEKRIQKLKFKDDLRSLKEKLKQVNFGQNPIIITSALRSQPQAAREIIKLIDGKPLEEWHRELKEEGELIRQLISLQNQQLEFNRLAGRLDEQLNQFVRNYNAERNAISVNDPAHISHFIGRLHGFQYQQINQWLDSGSEQTLQESWQNAQNETELVARTRPYLDARQGLVQTTESIRQIISES
ncbi:hypothetical protein KKH03_02020 [Patescibacteria group bacterium]|nr:hypothetical protein [Patescibacteria group bacterium]